MNFAWNQAFVVSWAGPYNEVCLGIGILLLIAFTWWKRRTRYPLVPTKYFTMVTTLTLVVICAGFASFGILEYYYFEFSRDCADTALSRLQRNSPRSSRLEHLLHLCSGYILDRFGASAILLYAMLAFCIGSVLLATAPVQETYWARTFVSTFIVPWGIKSEYCLSL